LAGLGEKMTEAKNTLASLKIEKTGTVNVSKLSGFQEVADRGLREVLKNNNGTSEIFEIYKELRRRGFQIGWRENLMEFCEMES